MARGSFLVMVIDILLKIKLSIVNFSLTHMKVLFCVNRIFMNSYKIDIRDDYNKN